LHAAAHAAAVGKARGLSKIVAALGLLRFLGRDFHRAEEIIDHIPRRSFRTKIKPGKYQGRAESMRIGFFVGCGADIMQQTATRASFELLKAFGRTIHVFDNCCCGLPAWSYGDMEAAQNLAEKNLSLILADDVDLIVTDCSSCASFLKKYPRLFPPGDAHHEYASVMGTKIKDIVELATPAGNDEILGEEPLRVTYHDPCHASRGQQLVSHPRKILQGIPGVRYIELPEADWCCGGAGSYAFSHYELSRKVLDRKIENIEQTGAQVVATSCPACMIHLAYGIRKHGLPVQVKHIAEMMPGPRA
jgi:glycolate oxidase iron-sulfur subunit